MGALGRPPSVCSANTTECTRLGGDGTHYFPPRERSKKGFSISPSCSRDLWSVSAYEKLCLSRRCVQRSAKSWTWKQQLSKSKQQEVSPKHEPYLWPISVLYSAEKFLTAAGPPQITLCMHEVYSGHVLSIYIECTCSGKRCSCSSLPDEWRGVRCGVHNYG